MRNGEKIVVLLAASVCASVLSYFGYKLVSRIKKRKNNEKFADPKYSIGAAIVNMERAVLYEDDENFKFFARYAIRTALGMPKSYPPNEPSTEEILLKLAKNHGDSELVKKIKYLYTLDTLAEDSDQWNSMLDELRRIIPIMLANFKPDKENPLLRDE
ncbi:MAG: hypothetical protein LBI56_00950 [Puniceicoccales bacterium]|jgi:hypothetical protein|nr:hypothetical protein [Puniceicoccales bacterium]